jgi:hypothetical protein
MLSPLLSIYAIILFIFWIINLIAFSVFIIIKQLQKYFFKSKFETNYYLITFGLSFISIIIYLIFVHFFLELSEDFILSSIILPIICDIILKSYFVYRNLSIFDIIWLIITSLISLAIFLFCFTIIITYFEAFRTLWN